MHCLWLYTWQILSIFQDHVVRDQDHVVCDQDHLVRDQDHVVRHLHANWLHFYVFICCTFYLDTY